MRDAGQAHRSVSSEAPANSRSDTVAVWDFPLRVWHWALAASVLVACVTPNTYDRLHRTAGYAVIGLLAFRLIWGLIGSRHSLFARISLKLRAAPQYILGMLRGETGRYLGLNPAGAAMLVVMLALLIVSTLSGLMQVSVRFFGVGWIEQAHALSSNAIIALIAVHVLGTLWMSLLQRENLARAMLTGRKRVPGILRAAPPAARPVVTARRKPEAEPVVHDEHISVVPDLPPLRTNPQAPAATKPPGPARMPRSLSVHDKRLGVGR
ncbi:putative Cytochrome b561 family protein [Bradyrhizobium sp. ORS 285]|uniref:cytochrome b/b6 domain-containing protein n=1 Tax=Bradyrhizobium sp. ORS 285 TaxID=115808 RepID=UPI000240841D|nr:cytochrome b/b6 domain-containing protein [Bradyrhizobium sp. ORS 285]CCD86241.1 putative Cytochrome b561 family protein [Bradyrhizobium sp. ORS 285]SMX60992.1 putative Cytochrome b561 family protein [Bradyrhizobium sp. ORS 285]